MRNEGSRNHLPTPNNADHLLLSIWSPLTNRDFSTFTLHKKSLEVTCRRDDMEYTNLGVGECECMWGVREGKRGGKEKGKIYDIFSPWIPNSNFARDHPTITKHAGNAPTPPPFLLPHCNRGLSTRTGATLFGLHCSAFFAETFHAILLERTRFLLVPRHGREIQTTRGISA